MRQWLKSGREIPSFRDGILSQSIYFERFAAKYMSNIPEYRIVVK